MKAQQSLYGMVTIANSRQHNFSFPLVLCHLALCLLAENCGLLILNFHVLLAENNGPKLMCVTLFSYHIFQIVSNKCFSCFFSIVFLFHLVHYNKQKNCRIKGVIYCFLLFFHTYFATCKCIIMQAIELGVSLHLVSLALNVFP